MATGIPAAALDGRHPGVHQIARHFEYGHLPTRLAAVSAECAYLAHAMLDELPDDPELTAGLRKLLEAKDCFVRAAVSRDKAGAASAGGKADPAGSG